MKAPVENTETLALRTVAFGPGVVPDAGLPSEIPLDRDKLFQVIYSIMDPVLIFNAESRVLFANPAFQKIIGSPDRIPVGQSLPELFEAIDPALADMLMTVFASGRTHSQEVSFSHNHQNRVFLLNVTPIRDPQAIFEGLAVFHEITNVKQTEKMRKDFVANVSHELRTPLSAIQGYAETLLEGALEDEAVARDFMQIILNHSNRLTQLVRDLLDLSKLESEDCPFELKPTDLLAVIRKVIELSEKHRTEKRIQLFFNQPISLPAVLANDTNIEQVLTNLVDNAIKYTPEGGSIQLRVTPHDNRMIRVDVEDTGIGIDSKHFSRLFERFYRVDKARSRDMGGTGLGLSIVKHIVQYHGGEVWVDSNPGQGSTFSFTLQIAQTEIEQAKL